jgi:MoxR-like ATPase
VSVPDLAALRTALAASVFGQADLVDRLLIGLMTGGHLLLEGPPGVAKTRSVRALAGLTGLEFQRIQFTPDLLPGDLVGTEVFQPATGGFSVHRGPVFTQLLLADEINRAPAKVQSALLEAMQERQVTLGGRSLPLPSPFLVIATQNPIEQEGTYPLPEAQLDRFLLKVAVGYPSAEEERRVLDAHGRTAPAALPTPLAPSRGAELVANLAARVDGVHVDDRVADYMVRLTRATRDPGEYAPELAGAVEWGASPRGTLALGLAARAMAVLEVRDHVIPWDVKRIARDALRHRLVLSFEAIAAELTAEHILDTLLKQVPVP